MTDEKNLLAGQTGEYLNFHAQHKQETINIMTSSDNERIQIHPKHSHSYLVRCPHRASIV